MTFAEEPYSRDNPAWVTCAIDVAGCSRLEICVPLYAEFEHADSALFETWPEAVRAKTKSIAKEWRAANPAREPVAITHAVTRDPGVCCVTIIHHREKKA